MLAGLRRVLVLIGAVALGTAVLSLAAGLAIGSTPARAVATGLYLVGAFFLLAGVVSGARGPLRAKRSDDRDPAMSMFGVGIGARGVRPATEGERHDAAATAALFLGLGLALIVFGVVADSTAELL